MLSYSQTTVISIHASQAGCDKIARLARSTSTISIHASQAGCDPLRVGHSFHPILFQSTHPKRDATICADDVVSRTIISIHASQAGCDDMVVVDESSSFKFQSTHPKRDATMIHSIASLWRLPFQSTHPKRDATPRCSKRSSYSLISIHASQAGCDNLAERVYFGMEISIHASQAGCDGDGERGYNSTFAP